MGKSDDSLKKENPRFSVIVPVYNVLKYLNKCIDSLIMQTYSSIEIILVDDGSEDGCAIICDQYAEKDNRIKVIHKKNEGIVSARQAGVNNAIGEFIACVDGDDWISKDYFLRFNQIIEQFNPDIVCCGYFEAYPDFNNRIDHFSKEGYYSRKDLENNIFPVLLCNEMGQSFSSSLWAKVFRRELYQKHQIVSVNVPMGEDDACVKPAIFHASSMYIFNDPLYFYRQNMQSVSRSKKVFPWDGPEIRAEHLNKHLDLDLFDLRNQLYRSLVFSIYTVAISQFNRDEPVKTICNDINEHLKKPIYKNAIDHCNFLGCSKGSLRRVVLKYRLYKIMKWHNKKQ